MKHAQHSPKAARPARPPAAAAPAEQKDAFVRQAAYYHYQARGCVGGHELEDWLKAEAEFERLSQPGDVEHSAAAGH